MARAETPNKALHLTGAALLVSLDNKLLQRPRQGTLVVRARAIMGVGSMFKKGGDYETATLLLLVAVFLVVGYSFAQQQVGRKGVTSTVKLEGTDFGYLSQLNGKY